MDTGTPVIWKDEVKEDLRDILHYLSRSPSAYVDNWSNELTKKLGLLESFSEMERKVPEKELTLSPGSIDRKLSFVVYISSRYNNYSSSTAPV